MPVFKVENRIEVPLSKGQVTLEDRCKFIKIHRLKERVGCYIFAVPCKYGVEGLQPIYVGKATESLDECLTNDKVAKINNYLRRHSADSLYLFLVVHPSQRRNRTAIGELETSLIKMAVSVNPKLINKKNTRPESWGIAGIIRGGKGKRSQGAKDLRLILGIDTQTGLTATDISTQASVVTDAVSSPLIGQTNLGSQRAAAPPPMAVSQQSERSSEC